ncbi:MAG TPA: hypothetical protein VNF50_03215 [Acidimicrobiales bacterium]|nr:hypothetical protein [Acidimicrobiales bacterium]
MARRHCGAVVLLLAAGSVLATCSGEGPASAATAGQHTSIPLTATLTAGSIGSRSITSVTPATITSSLGTLPTSTPLTVVVSEAAISGATNGWYVTAQASDFQDAAGNVVPATSLVDGANQVDQAGGGGVAAAVSGPGEMGAAETLFVDTGESASVLYTGTYTDTSTLTLSPPDGTRTGVYTSDLTVTLFT